ncbi:hypothetical protein [Spiractinospora alimapuensis]|uniref:hypothetical protein n=1 Tax=Spiractinospora alimapuensis TaxID=2820884 RepID=UPI001F3E948D|nr:hypothetical protein [Spiractinospora alimapuensis]
MNTEETEPAVEEPQDEAVDGQDVDVDVDPEGAEALGDPGKKALDATKAKWRAERDRRRALERELEEARRPQSADGDAPDADAIRQQATQEAVAGANARIVRAEVRAAAAGKLSDPKDALKFLDLDGFEVDGDGGVDADEIADAIDDLITNKPYLAAATARRFQGTGDGGSRNGGRPKQITSREDLAKMTPDQRLKAHQEGRLKNLLQN